jgi:hypothetical protein
MDPNPEPVKASIAVSSSFRRPAMLKGMAMMHGSNPSTPGLLATAIKHVEQVAKLYNISNSAFPTLPLDVNLDVKPAQGSNGVIANVGQPSKIRRVATPSFLATVTKHVEQVAKLYNNSSFVSQKRPLDANLDAKPAQGSNGVIANVGQPFKIRRFNSLTITQSLEHVASMYGSCPAKPIVQSTELKNVVCEEKKPSNTHGLIFMNRPLQILDRPDATPINGSNVSSSVRPFTKTNNIIDVLAMYGASHADKSTAPVPPTTAALLKELLEDNSAQCESPDKKLLQSFHPSEPKPPEPPDQGPAKSFHPSEPKPPAAKPHSRMDGYSQEYKKWQGSKQEWLTSQVRMDCINALSKGEVIKRRFEPHRPDLFERDLTTGKWLAKGE